jgi:hypothetical protein
MVVLVNRAKVSTATTGTGTITLGSAEIGYQTFADAGVVNAAVVRYVIEDGTNWEIGTGTYTTSGTTLSRTVSESNNSDSAINLSGSAVVFVGAVAADFLPPAANVTLDDTDLVVASATDMQDFADKADAALLRARGTGFTSTYVSTAAVGGTTFAQPAVNGEIYSDQGYFAIAYAGATGITVATLSSPSTYVYIDNAGNLQQQTSTPTRQDWSRKMFTMRIAVDTVAETILGFEYLGNPIGHYANSIRDLYQALLAQGVPFKGGQIITGRAGDLGFDVGAGTITEFGGTGDINNANLISLDAVTNATYDLLEQSAIAATNQTNLVKFWDNAGSITALGSGTFVAHRLYRFSNGQFAIQYGQGNYANIVLARAGLLIEDYILNERLINATFFGWWIIGETATNTGGTTLTEFREYTIGVQGGSSSGLAGCLLKGNNFSDVLDVGAAQVNLDLEPGVDVQAYDAKFTTVGAVVSGASGDGTTDDEAALDAFITAVTAHQDRAGTLQTGTYLTTNVNAPTAQSTIRGVGPNRSILKRDTDGVNVWDFGDVDYVTVSNVSIEMEYADAGVGHGISALGENLTFDRVEVNDFGAPSGDGGSGILLYPAVAGTHRSGIRITNSKMVGNVTGTGDTFGYIMDATTHSFMYGNHVEAAKNYSHELKNDAKYNAMFGLTAKSGGYIVGFGQETAGDDGADYNVVAAITGEGMDGGVFIDKGNYNVVTGVIFDGTAPPGYYGNQHGARLEGTATGNVVTGLLTTGAIDRPAFHNSVDGYIQIFSHDTANDIAHMNPSAEGNVTEIAHPGARTSIKSKINDISGEGLVGRNANVVFCHATGEYVGSRSGNFHWWLHDADASYYSSTKFRMEAESAAVLGFGTVGASGDTAGISINTAATPYVATMVYVTGSTGAGSYWSLRANGTDAMRFYDDVFQPRTDLAVDLGVPSNRFEKGYIKEIRTGDGTPIWTSRSGSPEGYLTAVVGSMCTRTDGGAGTTLYVKESGTGNTGWVAK